MSARRKWMSLAALTCAFAGCHRAPPSAERPRTIQIHIDERQPRCERASCSPLYIIDGVPLDPARVPVIDTTTDSTKRFTPLDPSEIDSIKPIRGPEALRLYGEAGRDGVILIWTSRGRRPQSDTAGGLSRVPVSPPRVVVPGTADLRPFPRGAVATEPSGPRAECSAGCRPAPAPLFVIDGAIAGRSAPDSLQRAFIDTVIVRRGAQAVARYGPAGADGVVEIRMLPPDTTRFDALPSDRPLSPRQASAICGAVAGGERLVVIDGIPSTEDWATRSRWPELRWSQVIRRDRYSPDEAMAEFGKAGRWGADLYTTVFAATADSTARRRPPGPGIVIRGQRMVVPSDTNPLFVIGGAIVEGSDSSLATLDPNDIEAVEVLKCMTAVTRYGRRARHGAVLVTLRKGAIFHPPEKR